MTRIVSSCEAGSFCVDVQIVFACVATVVEVGEPMYRITCRYAWLSWLLALNVDVDVEARRRFG